MVKITGKYNEAICYTPALEPSAEAQIQTMCDYEPLADSHIRIMPDVHAGKGCTIGTTMQVKDKVVPNLVGVDISCGILTVRLKDKRINLPELDSFIRKNIPYGFAVRERPHRSHGRIDINDLWCLKKINTRRMKESLGGLGSGNHFISVEQDESGNNYLLVHSGSRNPGLQVANYYQDLAYKNCGGREQKEIPHELAYLEGEAFEMYIHDMEFMERFAALNRRIMADDIIEGLGLHEEYRFDTTHNYIDTASMILRKGACSALKGQPLVIPMNMRDGTLICEGLGNPAWNCSAPHGAGRVMSRTEAKNSISMTDFKNSMQGIFTTSVDASTIDEAPQAYKPMEEIISQISDTVVIKERIRPIYNFKAGEESMKRGKRH